MIVIGFMLLSLGIPLETVVFVTPGNQIWLACIAGFCCGLGAEMIQCGIHAAIKKGE